MFNTRFEFATFAGGCFWCMVSPYDGLQGIIEVKAGYTGGSTEDPTYEEVCRGSTGHYEAIQIKYDPTEIAYKQLLDLFWQQIDPTDPGGQFYDRGQQYQTAIFYHNINQKLEAEESKNLLEKSKKFKQPIATAILPASRFYPAEDYHQDYHKKNSGHYEAYKTGSGRSAFIEKHWGGKNSADSAQSKHSKPSQNDVLNNLNSMQYWVTQENGTEPPFDNEYWDFKKEGIYVDIVSGEPLFSSKDKFDSGCGWPSFSKPLVSGNIVEKDDRSHFMRRTEVRSTNGNSHLGHVFEDGPQPTGLRYCINSASIRFIPRDELDKEGYGEYKSLFD